MAAKKVVKIKKKTEPVVTSKKRNLIAQYIDEMIELPILEYNNDSNNTDPFILNTLIFIAHFLLYLIPVLYYITKLHNKQVTCTNYTNSNGILFNNKTRNFDLYCKKGYEARYTAKSLYGLHSKEKMCVPMAKNYKQRDLYKMLLSSKKILNNKAIKIKVAYTRLDSLAKDLLYQAVNENHLNNPEKFRLKKINNYYMKIAKVNDKLQSRKFRYANKKSIFYKKS